MTIQRQKILYYGGGEAVDSMEEVYTYAIPQHNDAIEMEDEQRIYDAILIKMMMIIVPST